MQGFLYLDISEKRGVALTKRAWLEVVNSSPLGNGLKPFLRSDIVVDFDEHKQTIVARAETWVEHILESIDEETFKHIVWDCRFKGELIRAFFIERLWFRTNKPNAHEALFYETGIQALIREAEQRGYILPDNKFGSEIIELYKKAGFEEHELTNVAFEPPSFDELHELAQKDDELFPEPEPLRVEIAGTILNFTTWDAALVVYMDSEHKGKMVALSNKGKNAKYYFEIEEKREVIERPVEGGVVTAAIFSRIPLVNDYLRNYEEVIKRTDCTVRFETCGWKETITLFRETITELDWRGRSQ